MADYNNPQQPIDLFKMPVASEGTFKIPPLAKDASGRASISQGFPEETQVPLSQGGVAPNRMDFNGLFNMLSSYAFWAQSGGQWTYSPELNYTVPNLVYKDEILWWCLKDNGAGTADGVRAPESSPLHWQDFLSYMIAKGEDMGIKIMGGVDVGDIKMHYDITAPEGWFPCTDYEFSASKYPELYKKLGRNKTPDMRGLFVRGHDPEGKNDADGLSRALGIFQGDAIRNIYGKLDSFCSGAVHHASGVFGSSYTFYRDRDQTGWKWSPNTLQVFDASLTVPTAEENRPKNINLLYCIKHD